MDRPRMRSAEQTAFMIPRHHHPVAVVIAGCSGAGKTTVMERVIAMHPEVCQAISHTTRKQRPGEVDGVHYHFIDDAAFAALRAMDAFLEDATVYGKSYGTTKQSLADIAARRQHAIKAVDLRGCALIRERDPRIVQVWLSPSSPDEIIRRLESRGAESLEAIANRRSAMEAEIQTAQSMGFNYRVVNDDVDTAAQDIAAIIRAEACR